MVGRDRRDRLVCPTYPLSRRARRSRPPFWLARRDSSSELAGRVFTIGQWQAKIGDPSPVGWFTVISYYLCAALSLACYLRFRRRGGSVNASPRLALTAVILFLGLAKHFNLPGAVTEMGRLFVNQIGGYEWRRWAQAIALLAGAVALAFAIRWAARGPSLATIWRRCAPELICLCLLCTLFILRAVSLHHAGAVLVAEVGGIRLNWIVELTGIYALVFVLIGRLLGRGAG